MENEERYYSPGLDDDPSVPMEIRIKRYAEHLRALGSLEHVVEIAVTSAISLSILKKHLKSLEEKQEEQLKEIRDSAELAIDWGMQGLQIAEKNTEKLMLVLKKDIDRKAKLVVSGENGANSRKEKFAPVKEWALAESKKMRGADRDIARKLAAKVPTNISNPSKDTVRLIYDALRESRKT